MAQQYGGTEGLNAVLTGVGETTESFREQLRRSLTIKNWRETAFLKVAQVSYDEARAFYDERLEEARHGERMRALQILVPVPFLSSQNAELAKEQARKTAEEILKEAQDGANFEDLIQTRMDPTARAATNDGRVGWLVRGASGFPELEEVLFALKPGEVGGLVETPYSFHIVKALEYRPAGQVSFAEAKPEIILMLANRKIDQAVQARVDELRRQAKIEILDPSLAAAWPPKPAAADGAEGTEGAEGTGETTETREAGEAEGGGDVEAEAAGESAAAPAVGD
ncbi:MAG: peptidyl-prolyl cis-trans isomerase [Deltaproteobacteria bacterium]|nr:peptidyl-prolyl cis-trans isomerase [Deltaproteobacteria bacterium]